ncbi:MAG: hypothetical protein CML56_04605 [Rhodobacteraceae bacterium]|nr:hypothetical protein [Paracoccaceae bacterium]
MKAGDMIRFSGRYLQPRKEDDTHRFVVDVRPRDGIVIDLSKQYVNVLSQGERILILRSNSAIGPFNETKVEVISES